MSQQLIYVVDDEPLITRLVQVNLEHSGYVVAMAHDGREAMEALKTRQVQPALILLDVMMPYLDGFGMLQELRQDPELSRIPVVIMTARSRNEDLLISQRLGAEQYLPKPINPAELIAMVAAVLQNSSV